MLALSLGIGGFLLYLLYDINSFTWQFQIPRIFFMAGSVLIGCATILDLRSAWNHNAFSDALDPLLLLGGTVCFIALIYCLFFALPFKETNADQETGRPVYTGGVYALCRHPGILCFFGMYLLLGTAALPDKLLMHGMLFSLLNLAYAWFQDRITFPKTFCDYDIYQQTIPFLIPTKASIRLAKQSRIRSEIEEDNK